MFFTDIEFFIFLPITVVLYWVFPLALRYPFLLLASYFCYAYRIPWIAAIMATVALTNWGAALLIERYPERKKMLMTLCCILSLSFLAWFKYAMFFLENLKLIFPSISLTLQILLPAGISFFTFQALAYTADVYRGTARALKDPSRVLLFIAFFPHLVAGPIERSDNLLRQLNSRPSFSWDRAIRGIDLLLIGYVKKVVVADNIATYVNMIFDLKEPSTLTVLVGGIGFGIQILADFSAYTDIARGCGRLFGFELLENFNHPYLSTSPSDFWRRWHITLSRCIREYIYIPLGGSQVSTPRWLLNILFVWFICGLWHGAGWNFIAWGLFWGSLIIAYRFLPSFPDTPLITPLRISIMYIWITLGWILFRVHNLDLLPLYFSPEAFALIPKQLAVNYATLGLFLLYASPLLVGVMIEKPVQSLFHRPTTRWAIRVLGYSIAVLLLVVFAAEQGEDFYYFQF